MKRGSPCFLMLIILCVFFLAMPVFAATRGIRVRPVSPTGQEVKGNQWLFVIGIDTYIHWPRLKTAVNDAKAVKDTLLSRYYFDKNHVIELYDEAATRKHILEKLRFLARKVRGNDSVLIFYAGHGDLDPITKEGSWIPVESDTKDVSAWVSNHDIKNYLNVDAIKAKHILLVSDSCFSGDFFRGHRGKLPEVTDAVIKRAYKLTSRQAITSGGLEPVSDEGFGGHSVFTYFFLKTLRENQKPYLVPSDFFRDVKAGVAENAEQFPRLGYLKDTGGQQGGELVLFLKQESRLKALSAEAKASKEELQRLKKLEQEQRKAKQKETAEIAKREKELAALDAKIAGMRKKLGAAASGKTGGDLEAIYAMVKKREEQHQRLEALKKKREEEERKRKAEIRRLKEEKRKQFMARLEADVKKYEEIASSPYGKDMKEAAWKGLIKKYPQAAGVKPGNVEMLKYTVLYGGHVPVPGKTWKESLTGMQFVWVPGGCFQMGSNEGDDDEKPVHEVCVDGFWIGKYEVTQDQWKRIMGNNPSHFKKGDDYPVEQVSWEDVQEFIKVLNRKTHLQFRLPTEAEWEYAARSGGKQERYAGGNDVDHVAWYDGNSSDHTHRVGTKAPNGLGIYDMSGNVWEWCQDWYGEDYYGRSPRQNPQGPSSGSHRVNRGGSWNSIPWFVRASYRYRYRPGNRDCDLGFRLAFPPGQ